MDPTEESKLLTEILPLKICDEADEAFKTSQRHGPVIKRKDTDQQRKA